MAIKIIDVSEHQGSIDWSRISALYKSGGIAGVILRCGYGSDIVGQDDKQWDRNVKQCEYYGIPYGVYLYSYASDDSHASSEVAHFKRLIAGHKPDFPCYIDLEEARYAGFYRRAATIWCNAVKSMGLIDGVYSGQAYVNSVLAGFPTSSWWIPRYGNNDAVPETWEMPQISVKYDGWQYTSTDKINGISGNVDVSIFYKDYRKNKEYTAPKQGTKDILYRLYNPSSADHFYTASVSERNALVNVGWRYEGIAWNIPKSGTPVYRFYNKTNGDHIWVTAGSEFNSLQKSGWTKEGVAFYSSASDKSPVYRLYNPASQDHFYTASAAERDSAIKKLGYKYEGVAFFAG